MVDHDAVEVAENLVDAALERGVDAPHDEPCSSSEQCADASERCDCRPALFLFVSHAVNECPKVCVQTCVCCQQTPDLLYASSVARRVACCPQREHSWMPNATSTAASTMRTTSTQRSAMVAARPMLDRASAVRRVCSFSGVSRLLPSYRSTRARWNPVRVAVLSACRLASAVAASAASVPRRVRDSDRSICAQSLSWSRASACCASSRSRSRPLMNMSRRCAYRRALDVIVVVVVVVASSSSPVPSSRSRARAPVNNRGLAVLAPSSGAPSVSFPSLILCLVLVSTRNSRWFLLVFRRGCGG